METKLFKNCYL